MATKKVNHSDNALVKILHQQKKAEEMQTGPTTPRRVKRSTEIERTARLYMNRNTLAIGLYENDVEVAYTPASSRKVAPFTYMQQWVEHGTR